MSLDELDNEAVSSSGRVAPGRWLDELLQCFQPREWRIHKSLPDADPSEPVEAPETGTESESARHDEGTNRTFAELATCLWYLKTKFLRQDWGSEERSADDARSRRALGRLSRGVDALRACGVEVEDPTDKRYPDGGENMMKPIQFTPTEGLTHAMVSETVAPMVYRAGQLIQRAEVFVATPIDEIDEASAKKPKDTQTESPDGVHADSAAEPSKAKQADAGPETEKCPREDGNADLPVRDGSVSVGSKEDTSESRDPE